MRPFELRTDLERHVIDGFALPLGLVPDGIAAPDPGYAIRYTPGEDDREDSYSYSIVVSHERVGALMREFLDLLPDRVHGIVEIGSRDAYRTVDEYMAQEPIAKDVFLDGWTEYEAFLLEDSSIAVGTTSEEPFVEVFLDQWKAITVHVPLLMRGDVDAILDREKLEEVIETWPELEEDESLSAMQPRSVLQIVDEFSADVDEVLLELRTAWNLELNIDPDVNVNDAGREIGVTLWHALVVAESQTNESIGAYVSIWATAGCLSELEEMIMGAIEDLEGWQFSEIFTIDRVAFDERPDELGDLPPVRAKSEIHLMNVELWQNEGADDPSVERAEDGE